MRVEVMEHYGLTRPIDQAGYYETAHHKQLLKKGSKSSQHQLDDKPLRH